MPLSLNEVRRRAAAFAKKWRDAKYEKGETQSFYNDFFHVFDIERRSVARYEQHVRRLDNSRGYIDLFWPSVLLVEQKSAGRDLGSAYDQAGAYFDALPEHERPRYILLSDFQNFELHDLDERKTIKFALGDLPERVEEFNFIRGVERRAFRDQDPANIEAAELVGRLHDALERSGYRGHDLERFLVRVVFCLFADDTGIFEPRGIFLELIETRTSQNGADLGSWLSQLFQVLNTPEAERLDTLDEDLAAFPHVNGVLFEDALRIPSFDSAMRAALLEACHFNWSNISPAIFGALFQSVMDRKQRRKQGAHYTTEKNILKVIEPLFMDDLWAKFNKLKARKGGGRVAKLRQFQEKLGRMKFFDPACGCGNFLIIAYRELRLLEIEVIREVLEATRKRGQEAFDAKWQSVVDVDQFYGVELGEFPARIAETALWMMDHLMNNQLSFEFGQSYVRIPLETTPNILHRDALETDWTEFLPPEECSFVLGNPPFAGAKLQDAAQREQVRRIAALGGSGGTLDYVAAWFIKAGDYINQAGRARIGFVATNSITQGEQVGQLWPLLLERHGLDIAFAHRTFAWGSEARGKAQVHVVILGLDRKAEARPEKRLFSYPDINGEPEESLHAVLSPYLFDAGGLTNPNLAVREAGRPINGMKKMTMGSQPIDNRHYIFDTDQRAEFLKAEPGAKPFLRPYIGAEEYLNGDRRWILALHEASPTVLKRLPRVRERIAAVRAYREASKRISTQKLAATPTLYQVNIIPDAPFLIVPLNTSQRREYVPIGWLEPPIVPSNAAAIIQNATLADFALLTSAMHMAWLRYVGGRLGSGYRYSIGLVYNTFPMPTGRANLSKLEPHAQAVLDARAAHRDATPVELYDPNLMPPDLRRAHQALDRAVDRLYRRKAFASEHERIEHLFALYEKMQAPLKPDTKVKKKRVRRKR